MPTKKQYYFFLICKSSKFEILLLIGLNENIMKNSNYLQNAVEYHIVNEIPLFIAAFCNFSTTNFGEIHGSTPLLIAVTTYYHVMKLLERYMNLIYILKHQ